jgi:hypothetical protein
MSDGNAVQRACIDVAENDNMEAFARFVLSKFASDVPPWHHAFRLMMYQM